MDNTSLTILVAVISAGIGAAATLLMPMIQKRLDKKGLSDKEMLLYWKAAFDRSAFRGPFMWHTDQAKFEQVLRDTIQAVNTGHNLSQNPGVHGAPRVYLKNKECLRLMTEVADHLQKITWALSHREALGDNKVAEIADEERDTAVILLNKALELNGIDKLEIPTKVEIYRDDIIIDRS